MHAIVLLTVTAVVCLTYVTVLYLQAPTAARTRIHDLATGDTSASVVETATTEATTRVRAGCRGAAITMVVVTAASALPVHSLVDSVGALPLAVMVAVVGAGICGAALTECWIIARDVPALGASRFASLTRRDLSSAVVPELRWLPWTMVLAAAVLCGVAVARGVAPWPLIVVAVSSVAFTLLVVTTTLMVVVRRPVRAGSVADAASNELITRDTEHRLAEYLRQSGLLAMFFTYMLVSDSPGWGLFAAVFVVFMAIATVYRVADKRRTSRERSPA